MSEEGEDKDSKTEEPSQRKLDEAYKKGQVPFSKEVANFLMLSTLTLLVMSLAPGIMQQTKIFLLPFLAAPQDMILEREGLSKIFLNVTLGFLGILTVPIVATSIAAIAAGFLQIGFRISADPIKPKLEKISPIKGLGRIFSKKAVVELLKGVFKFSVMGLVCFLTIYPELKPLQLLVNYTVPAIVHYFSGLAARMLLAASIFMFFVALFDVVYQRMSFMKSMRMSKQELKDEYKQQEGDPKIKQRLRKIRMERAQTRMMAEVPKADVVITNPTHYAVALKYEQGGTNAPVVTAKGMDIIAQKIREVAKENKVPIVENPPLARALHADVKLGDEIPLAQYEAVAKVISYVYGLRKK